MDDELSVPHAQSICHKRKLDLVRRRCALAENELAYGLRLIGVVENR